jgi:hypothetical protein
VQAPLPDGTHAIGITMANIEASEGHASSIASRACTALRRVNRALPPMKDHRQAIANAAPLRSAPLLGAQCARDFTRKDTE